MNPRAARRLATIGMLLLAGAACSDSHEPDVQSPVRTTILLADAPFPYNVVSRVTLYVLDVRMGTDTGSADSPCSEAEIVVAPYRAFELLELQRGAVASLGEADLPPGEYRTVCLTIEPERSFIWGPSLGSARIQWGAPGTRVLKAELLTPIVVGGDETSIVLHFDLGASFLPLPLGGSLDLDSGFVFRPVLTAVDRAKTGALAGRVVVGPTGSPIAEAAVRLSVGSPGTSPDTWSVIATGVTDAAGTFRLAFLPPSQQLSAQGRSYVLDVAPPEGRPFAPARLEGVEVFAGRENPAFDIVLAPLFDLAGNRIAFVVDETNVASMRENGANRALLTDYPYAEYGRTEIAAWSPDGTELLGKRVEITPLTERIVTIAADGSGIHSLADGLGAWGIDPGTWSPDGGRLAYVMATAAHGAEPRIYTVARDGSGRAMLETRFDPCCYAADYAPAWSPDGEEIAFLSYRSNSPGAFIVPAEGGLPRRLVPEGTGVYRLAWAPDGLRLAFLSGYPAHGTIFVINRDGTGMTRLSSQEGVDDIPVWSPDGSRLAFISTRDGNEELYVMSADGTGVRRLTNHPALDRAPTWSPDGTRLAFQTERDGNWEIYAIGVDGSGLTNLTRSPAHETQPQWR